MKRISYLLSGLFLSVLFACSGGAEQKEQAQNESSTTVEIKQTCTYAASSEQPEVLWVAYKYTEKVGVKGEFEEVAVSNTGTGNTISAVLAGAQIAISTASSNSGDPTRDPKIKDTFFGALVEGEKITGEITNVKGDEEKGTVVANLKMNGQENPTTGTYEVKNDVLEMKFELDVATWSAMDALNALNEVCEDLHKGADGKSILWPDVTVFVTTQLVKDCQ
jgi:polyisoprenoid-binding protein YceI